MRAAEHLWDQHIELDHHCVKAFVNSYVHMLSKRSVVAVYRSLIKKGRKIHYGYDMQGNPLSEDGQRVSHSWNTWCKTVEEECRFLWKPCREWKHTARNYCDFRLSLKGQWHLSKSWRILVDSWGDECLSLVRIIIPVSTRPTILPSSVLLWSRNEVL